MNKVIIADASPLIAFGGIDKLSVLFDLFGKVVIPEVVAAECLVDKARPGATAIAKAIDDKQIQIAHSTNEMHEANDEKLGRDVAKKLGVKIIGTIGVLLLAKEKKMLGAIKPILLQLKKWWLFFI